MGLTTPDSAELKARLRSSWMAGDFGEVAKYSRQWAEELIVDLPVSAGMKVLDVACGTGNFCISAARRGVTATGIDIAPNLLDQARARAASEGMSIQFDEGDAEQLPYENASFDLVVSMFGAIFAPRPEIAAAELIRVCRSGGTIAMTNWTPQGFTGQMLKLIGKYVPPPPDVPSPLLWGEEDTVRERLGDGIAELKLSKRNFDIALPFNETEVVNFFRRYFGPVQRSFETLGSEEQAELQRALEQLWKDNNSATDGTTFVEAEYLQVIAFRS